MRWIASRTTTPARLLVALLALFGVVLGCAVAAGELLGLAERPDGSTGFDSSITTWVVAHRSHGLTTLAKLLSTVGSQAVLIPITAIVAALLIRRRQYVSAAMLIAAWGGALALYNLIKLSVHRPRPPADIWLTKVASTSFPSGHATQSLATFVALALVLTGAGMAARARGTAVTLAVVLAAGVGCSRVYLGVHWTTDVLAGWLIAVAWLAIVLRLAGPAAKIRWRPRSRAARTG